MHELQHSWTPAFAPRALNAAPVCFGGWDGRQVAST